MCVLMGCTYVSQWDHTFPSIGSADGCSVVWQSGYHSFAAVHRWCWVEPRSGCLQPIRCSHTESCVVCTYAVHWKIQCNGFVAQVRACVHIATNRDIYVWAVPAVLATFETMIHYSADWRICIVPCKIGCSMLLVNLLIHSKPQLFMTSTLTLGRATQWFKDFCQPMGACQHFICGCHLCGCHASPWPSALSIWSPHHVSIVCQQYRGAVGPPSNTPCVVHRFWTVASVGINDCDC